MIKSYQFGSSANSLIIIINIITHNIFILNLVNCENENKNLKKRLYAIYTNCLQYLILKNNNLLQKNLLLKSKRKTVFIISTDSNRTA